ncbi:histidine--tRNA ligase [Candidatus Micrarchaeota archaeon]|nr:histidine--tRNA ligase [Candidatus Micrarchaeota archaeon]
MDLSPPKGMRDFLPSEASRREWIADTLKAAFKRYGFLPLETPIAERFEVLSSKFAGGEEILKETYRFQDQGKRDLGLRYDLTVPMCRVLAGNAQLAKPFKRYQIAPVFRDGPLKKGRYREFVQCDVDTVGVAGMLAEAELLALASDAFASIGLQIVLKVNNRKLLNGLLEDAGVSKDNQAGALLSLDKLEKIGPDGVLAELERERHVRAATGKKLLNLFEKAGSGVKALAAIKKTLKSEEGKAGLSELEQLFGFLDAFGVNNTEFVPSLSRGLNYYTGTVYEAFLDFGRASGAKGSGSSSRSEGDADSVSTITSSLAAGGRYDKMVGDFSNKSEIVPAVGISFGLDVIGEALKETVSQSGSQDVVVNGPNVFVIAVGETQSECIQVSQHLRTAGISVLMDLSGRGVSKNLQWAAKQGLPFVVIVGESEVKDGKFTLRDLMSGHESKLSKPDLVKKLSN